MLKIIKFLKPFVGAIVLALILLFVQALCDLNLPNLMSDIVNVGIQQGGVEDRSPQAVSKDGYQLSKAFMDDDDQQLLDANYTLVTPADKDEQGRLYSEDYPEASADGFYVLKAGVSSETRGQLDEAFGLSTWTMVKTLTALQEQQAAGGVAGQSSLNPPLDSATTPGGSAQNDSDLANGGGAGNGSESADSETSIKDIDFAEVYKILPMISQLPAQTISDARAEAAAMDPLMRSQSATMLAANFYRELGVDMTQYEIGYIVRIGLIMLLITLIGGACTVGVGFFSSHTGAGVARDLREAVFTKISGFSHTEFDRFSTASLITRSTNDVTQIQMLITMGIRMILYAPIMAIGAIIMALQKSVSMSWIIGLGVLVLICVLVVLMIVVMPKFTIIQKLIDRLNLVARETLNGQMVIRAFGRSQFEEDRFEKANADVTATNLFIQRAMVFMMPVLMMFMNGLTVLIIWIGAQQVAESQMQVGDMMAYMQYAMMVVMSFMFIAMAFIFVPRAAVSAGRIAQVLETQPVIVDPVTPTALPADVRGQVEFKDVSFRFEGAELNALCNISFVAKPGTTTAFIGSTGSGKSTILNLIPRFYDVTEGAVLVDGVDVREVRQSELRSHIGYVPQQSVLMSGTIAQNISFGAPDLPEADIQKVAEVAQALDFIQKLDVEAGDVSNSATVPALVAGSTADAMDPAINAGTEGVIARTENGVPNDSAISGFEFEIAQGGTNVSGGQRQRLSIARALAVNPDIFLFDDSFSALDFATDAALRKALAAYTSNATMIIVAQRVSTIMDADQIFVIDDGMIVGSGSHQELLKTCPAYLEIASSQLSETELGGGE